MSKRPCTWLGFLSEEISKERHLKNAWERRAKYNYRCSICDYRIPKGSQYIGTIGRDNGKILTWYYHIKCLLEEDFQIELVKEFLKVDRWTRICPRCGMETSSKTWGRFYSPEITILCPFCRNHCSVCEVNIVSGYKRPWEFFGLCQEHYKEKIR